MDSSSNSKDNDFAALIFRGLTVVIFLVLLARVFDLQIIRGKYFRDLAEGNRLREIPILAMRGDITARGGEVIAGSREIKKKIIFDNKEGFKKEATEKSSGEGVVTEWQRIYPGGEIFAHLTGYIGEINENELGKINAKCPEKGSANLGDFTGRGGLEDEYDCKLRGADGGELLEINSIGRPVRTLGRKNSVSGKNIRTTIDFELQKFSYDLIRGKRGAVIILDKNGQVLTLVSSPSFDPNYFVEEGNFAVISSILNDKSLPLLNRVISGSYHPGSIYKPLVAAAALEEGAIDRNFVYEDTGKIVTNSIYGNFSFANWFYLQYGSVEGKINLTRALARSTDTFFYKVGELTGIDNMAKWSKTFGLNEITGIDLPGEIPGLVPDPAWKEKNLGERWYLGNTYNMAIGQGDLAVTPMEITTAIASLGNGGRLCKPRLVEEDKEYCRDLGIKKENIELIKEGMVGVCEAGGTAFTFFDFKDKFGKSVACKTGTAQNVNKDPHSWFTAFAPSDDPEIIVTVLVEEGGEGSKVAGPVARKIFDYWFTKK